jgi:molybdenum cofactor guanylyltransferase
VANDRRASDWFPGERVVADAAPGLGPLAGIAAGLEAAAGAPVVVVAWDMPFVTADLLLALRRRSEGGTEAVIPVDAASAHAQPLVACYPASALPVCRSLLAAGERRAVALLDALPTARRMRPDELAPFGDPSRIFTSVDSPEQLAALGGSLDA